MKSSLLILAASALLIGANAAQAAPSKGHGAAILIPPPTVESITPPIRAPLRPRQPRNLGRSRRVRPASGKFRHDRSAQPANHHQSA